MAFLTPLVTGQYSFFITSDDQGELLMSDQPNITNVTRCVYNVRCISYYISLSCHMMQFLNAGLVDCIFLIPFTECRLCVCDISLLSA